MNYWGKNFHCRFLALTAALFLAFGPAFVPVLSASSKNSFIEICTAFGAVKMAVAGDYASGDSEKDNHEVLAPVHCVFCNLRQIALSPPQPPFLPLPPVSFEPVFASAYGVSYPAPSFSAHSPRAPPVFS